MFKLIPDIKSVKIPDFIDDFRPYNEAEALEAFKRIAESEVFFKILQYFFPEESIESQKKLILNLKSIKDFQIKVMYKVVNRIIKNSITNLSISGIENIHKDKNYVFLSNHRDILLDSSLFLYLLVNKGFDSTEITFGNNLMTDSLIIDIGKINKMFKVYRDGKPKELMEKTAQLSEYIKYTILEKKQSIWIAQRGGRTKDGNDKTQASILKMLNSSGKGTFEDNLREINIVPVSISYEYEPCDYLKVRELYNTIDGKYFKQKDEDINSIIEGAIKHKGNVHLKIGKVISSEYLITQNESRLNAKTNLLAKLIDKQVCNNYRLWKTNYIAADILSRGNKYSDRYSLAEKEGFEKYIDIQTKKVEGNQEVITKMLLKIYAKPVFNYKAIN